MHRLLERSILSLILLIASVNSVSQTGYGSHEEDLLRTLQGDTVASVSAFLPERFSFGVRGEMDGKLMLVKDGPYNRLLLEGTHRVYDIRTGDGVTKVERIDNTLYQGDNLDMIAFRRKDTLYQYGGFGNWTHRDFITRYRDATSDWEYVAVNGRMPENRWTPFQYDAASDRLYVFGSKTLDHRDQSERVSDSVYVFDFPTLRWTAATPVANSEGILPFGTGMGTSSCSFGKGVIFTHEGRTVLADLSKSTYRVLSRDSLLDDTRLSVDTTLSPDSILWLLLSDTLHAFVRKEGADIHFRRAFSFDEAMGTYAKRLDESVGGRKGKIPLSILLIAMSLAALHAAQHRKRKSGKDKTGKNAEADATDSHGYEANTNTSMHEGSPSHREILASARENLAATDWDLFVRLVALSAEGKGMEASTANQILGVAQKSSEMMKSRRNKSLSNINRVFARLGLDDDPLVVHERDKTDKRAFRYRIREGLAKDLLGIVEDIEGEGEKSD